MESINTFMNEMGTNAKYDDDRARYLFLELKKDL
jgi:hypothetical protein